ncbi:hypothetical protein CNBB0980 [Cryptococcus deneoformans B-3501A]|uniref:hypothetical protein n=1 Tax=Cryptococcus deneoformans (strain B-3501A) TaxID=283643 RepID=UPI000042D56F|nr:hypothetical protein CNBB0980 [Cryptococcus neoformans var. neoformans B-3501A]EAL22648.1 hypothetical protein CNBB0980 [Cryptococcus neoformans var. neoformans B-3501A]
MSLSEHAKGKQPLSVTGLDGPPRLSSNNDIPSGRVSERKWRDAFTGEPADPLIKEELYESKIDYSYRPVENGSNAWFVVAPGLTNDEDQNPNPHWWDEATKKAAEWIISHRQVTGLDPSYDLQRSVSLWSSVLANELRHGLATYEKSGGYSPECPRLAIVKEDDLGHMYAHGLERSKDNVSYEQVLQSGDCNCPGEGRAVLHV